MSNIPEDIKKGIKSLSERTKIPAKDIVKELKQIISSDETIQTIKSEEQKVRFGWALIARRYLSNRKTVDMYIRPANYPRPRKVKTKGESKYNSNFVCIARIIDEETDKPGKPQLAAGTLWEKAAENTMHLSPKKVYKTSLVITEEDKGLVIGGNDATFTEEKSVKIPSAKVYYKKVIQPKEDELIIDLADMKINDGENAIDYRVIEATVMNHQVGINTNNEEYGNYELTDNSLIRDEESEGRFTVWVHPKEVNAEKGSRIKIVGVVNYDKNNKIARWTHFFIVPTEDASPIIKKEGEKEAMDADDILGDDEENINEVDEEEEEEDTDDEDDDEDLFSV